MRINIKSKPFIITTITVLSLIILFVVLSPFIFDYTSSEYEINEAYFNKNIVENQIVFKNDKFDIRVYGDRAVLNEKTLKINTIKPPVINVGKNETPLNYLLDDVEYIVKYNINMYNTNDKIYNEETFYKVQIPIPNGFSNNIKVFQTAQDGYNFCSSQTVTGYVIFYTNSLGEFSLVDDEMSVNDTTYFEANAISLTYKDILSLNVYTDIYSGKYEDAKVLIYFSEKDKYTIENADKKLSLKDGKAVLSDMEFKDIDKTIYIKTYLKLNKKEYYGTLLEYNILQYYINLYNNINDDTTKNLVLSTICYSQISNDFVERKTNIFEQFKNSTSFDKNIEDVIKGVKFSGKNQYSIEGDIYFYGRTMDLDNKITYNMYLSDKYKGNIDDIVLSVKINDEELNVKFKKDTAYNLYVASFKDIQPYDINTPLILSLKDKVGKQIGGTLTDSVGTYINEALPEYTLSKDKEMFSATVYFMTMCEKYFQKEIG